MLLPRHTHSNCVRVWAGCVWVCTILPVKIHHVFFSACGKKHSSSLSKHLSRSFSCIPQPCCTPQEHRKKKGFLRIAPCRLKSTTWMNSDSVYLTFGCHVFDVVSASMLWGKISLVRKLIACAVLFSQCSHKKKPTDTSFSPHQHTSPPSVLPVLRKMTYERHWQQFEW